MTDIAAFLNARLDEDEALAREASAFYDDDQTNGVPWNGHEGVDLNGRERYWIAPHLGVVNHVASGRHIGRHDPARVLREVAAKRAIVWQWEQAAQRNRDDECDEAAGSAWATLGNTLVSLTGVYDSHPDYAGDNVDDWTWPDDDPAWTTAT